MHLESVKMCFCFGRKCAAQSQDLEYFNRMSESSVWNSPRYVKMWYIE